jgi:hypothetical protein
LAPLGVRAEPALPERSFLEAVGAHDGDLLWLRSIGVEIVPKTRFQLLTRASIRLALKDRS